jgi:hypothetical protein
MPGLAVPRIVLNQIMEIVIGDGHLRDRSLNLRGLHIQHQCGERFSFCTGSVQPKCDKSCDRPLPHCYAGENMMSLKIATDEIKPTN